MNNGEERGETIQVLSLDGGGLRGIFSAAALAAWEDDFDCDISDHFDLIVGTSTGGIIALGLGLGVRPRTLLDLYVSNAAEIFPRSRGSFLAATRWAWSPRYKPDALREVLDTTLRDQTLAHSSVRLAIPSYDLASDDVYLFRTPHAERLRRDWRERAVDVALATSAAPTYLPSAGIRAHRLIDGGVWANNPTMVGLVEAIDCLDAKPGNVRILNVGTTTELKERSDRLDRGGLWHWRADAIDLALKGQSLSAINHSRLIAGRENVVRVDVPVPEGLHALDRVDPADLIARAEATSRNRSPRVADFLRHRPETYTPIYGGKRNDDG